MREGNTKKSCNPWRVLLLLTFVFGFSNSTSCFNLGIVSKKLLTFWNALSQKHSFYNDFVHFWSIFETSVFTMLFDCFYQNCWFYTVFLIVSASQFQTGQFLQCFWGETAATCFLQWFWRSFYSTEKLSFTKSFSCFCDVYVLKCSLYIMFLIVFAKRIFWIVAFTLCFLHFNRSELLERQLYTMCLRFSLFEESNL